MSLITAVEVPRPTASLLEPIIGSSRYLQLSEAAGEAAACSPGGRSGTSTRPPPAAGWPSLQVLVGHVDDFDIPIGGLVISGDAEFFALTKRLHNQIHGDFAGPHVRRRLIMTRGC